MNNKTIRIDNELFRFIRVTKRLTQREYASLLGVSHALVSHVETNILTVSDRVHQRVVNVFELTQQDLHELNELLKKMER